MRKYAAVLALCLLLAMLGGCASAEDPAGTTEAIPTQTVSTQPPATTEPAAPTAPAVKNAVPVKTPYGTIYYQDQWQECMVVEQIEEGNCVILIFEAEINAVRYPLFKLVIGSDPEQSIATVTGDDGQQYGVSVVLDEIGIYDALTSEQQNRLYAMQEEINFILGNLN